MLFNSFPFSRWKRCCGSILNPLIQTPEFSVSALHCVIMIRKNSSFVCRPISKERGLANGITVKFWMMCVTWKRCCMSPFYMAAAVLIGKKINGPNVFRVCLRGVCFCIFVYIFFYAIVNFVKFNSSMPWGFLSIALGLTQSHKQHLSLSSPLQQSSTGLLPLDKERNCIEMSR